jgi:tRNA modification GTPase
LSGDGVIALIDRVFKGKSLEKQASHTIHFGILRDGDMVIDEVLVSLFRAPRSYTGQDTVEISCHGSPYLLQRVMELLLQQGARMAKAGEFTLRAFLNGKMNLSQAEAVADLIAAENKTTHTLAIQQMRGGYSLQIAQLRQQLIDFAALIELELDFSTEDVEFADRSQLLNLLQHLQTVLQQLTASFSLGNVLKNGVTSVIAGRPNAGKSTLLNALLNEERAIVSDIAGTTRDTIEEVLSIEGVSFRLIDTAGIRQATDTIEAIGVQKTWEKISQSAILLYVFDFYDCIAEEILADIEQMTVFPVKLLVIANKCDQIAPETIATYRPDLQAQIGQKHPLLLISAKKTSDIATLKATLFDMVMQGKIAASDTTVSNARHYEAFTKALQALQKVRQGIQQSISGELLAFDIRAALHHLGEITGDEITNENLLDSIFTRFCIGK